MPISKSASHLFLRGTTYHFRMNLPADVRPVLGRRELKVSLQTGRLRDARSLATRLSAIGQHLVAQARNGEFNGMTDQEIQRLVNRVLRKALDDDMRLRMVHARDYRKERYSKYIEQPFGIGEFHKRHCAPWRATFESEKYLERYQWLDLAEEARDHLRLNGVEINDESDDFKAFCYFYAKKLNDYFSVIIARDDQDERLDELDLESMFPTDQPAQSTSSVLLVENPAQEEQQSPAPQAMQTQPAQATDSSIKVSELIDMYIKEHKKVWSPATYRDYKGSYQTLMEDVIGDVPVNSINKARMRKAREIIDKYPVRRKLGKLKGKSLEEIFQMDSYDVISVGTKNKYINMLSGLFEWASNLGFMEVNPASKIQFRDPVSSKDKVKMFTGHDLHKIFHATGYKEDAFSKNYMFWIPIIGLFTGARQNEICQLHLDDIRQESGVWIFDLSRLEGNQSVKNEASKRYVPIHPFLVEDLNLIGLKEQLQAEGHERLFPELPLDRASGKYQRNMSKWFNDKFLRSVGVKKDRTHNFHSFRHTLQTYLDNNAPEPAYVEAFLGHSSSGEGARTYNKGFHAQTLFDRVVRHIDFEKDMGLNLSHLKQSKYIVKG